MNSLQAPLSQEIQREYNRLIKLIASIPAPFRTLKKFEGTGGKASAIDLIAYQIGWGKSVIRWYEAGVRGELPEMPGEGFSAWDYTAIAQHFYQKYQYDGINQQMEVFHQVVSRLLEIVEVEHSAGRLDCTGAWCWCTLPSGKQWTLSKWIRVNTTSPYKRARMLMQRGLPIAAE
jgi:hypothetical protein